MIIVMGRGKIAMCHALATLLSVFTVSCGWMGVEHVNEFIIETDTAAGETDTAAGETDTAAGETDTVAGDTDTAAGDTDTVLETDCGDYPDVDDPGFVSGERYEVCGQTQEMDCVPASQLNEDEFVELFVCERSPFCGCSASQPCGPISASEFTCCYVMNVTRWCE